MKAPSAPPRDIVLLTLDALRYDVAVAAWRDGRTPYLRSLIPDGWQRRHTPGNFTFAAHAAFFAGFWPTPDEPGNETDRDRHERHVRPFALQFIGSRSVGAETIELGGPNIVAGLCERGYQTTCIGGTGFFNPATPLGAVFPAYFQRTYWRPEFAVTELNSPRAQMNQAAESVAESDRGRPLFLFINVSATHPPTFGYLRGARADSVATQGEALAQVDRRLPQLFEALARRPYGGTAYLMSDHGTLFGEEGRTGHRTGHADVWTVPYAEFRWEAAP
jgi:hypothetical protein